MTMLSSTMMTYYLPFFYQAKGHSAVKSGIDILPFMLIAVAGSIASGWLTKVTGRYMPFLLVGPVMMAVSGGLFFIVDEHTRNANLIGYQILYGFGVGLIYQIPCEFLFNDPKYAEREWLTDCPDV
jgi:MFS family permease